MGGADGGDGGGDGGGGDGGGDGGGGDGGGDRSCVRCLPRKSQWGKLTTTLAQGGHTGLHRTGTMSDSSSGPAPQRQLSHSKAGRQA